MKFSDGYWKLKDGISLFTPVDIRDIKFSDNKLTVYAATKVIRHRGDTLNLPVITVEYSSPLPDIIGVKIYHHKGKKTKGPEFELRKQPDTPVDVKIANDEAILTSGKLSVKVKKGTQWRADFFYGDRYLTGSSGRSAGYIKTSEGLTYVREQLNLGIGECVYGLGERFTHFVKNGQTVDIWNEDGGTSSEQAYKNIPFYITNRGYGVFVNHPERVSYEIGSEVVTKVQFSVPGEYLEYFIIGGETLKDVLKNYTALTGRPHLPPAWSFGLWLSTSFTTDYDEKTVLGFINGMFERDIPVSVFHFDCFWMKEFQWCDFTWDKDVFPDPESMLQKLKAKGLKICVWINPYIAQKSYLFDEGMEKGYLLKNKNGDVWQWDMWQAGMALIDFTNPDACKWYQEKLKALLDMGVDCFKTDFGERIPTDVVYYDGSDPEKMHNYYTYLYNKTVFDLLKRERGDREAVVFARSATAGSQKFPVHWGGDCTADYPSMAESLRGGLSLCASGFAFWSHDIGGFENTATPDLYKRWVAFGLLSTHSRLHGSESYRVPWLFDEEASEVLSFFTKLKYKLMPYIFAAAYEASTNGIPVMRPMVLEFTDDPACDYLDRQYMLGEKILVAPVFSEDGSVNYYVPEGTWTNFLSNEKIQGGKWLKEVHGYFSLPLLVRPDSLIAVGSNENRPDYDYAENVTFHLFELQDGHSAESLVYNQYGITELTLKVTRKGNTLVVNAKGNGKPWRILLRNIFDIQKTDQFDVLPDKFGVIIEPAGNFGEFSITVNERF
ncbi:alpha-xylosidase [Thermoclostridium stercorarium subsp. thermolacticum DSM 2910]|uniref:alpha-D-xyloside xylohydrolase n=1 Tax=Thermoclostridium stercorarium subsp. thermolacticum DSM 2910 TaxID=1121336 RepID=A0A1B1YCU8_THEST|nr:alpha-xylosidase [Thermoclostridium stercorarium]ANW98578.1 alpha-xylosidase [Thermoclostridium stercorarium subsp. thermolacticum DSM 2910]UZQ86735.1 alpha-xylosidase [Thermoclostridium stercorarium]